MSSAKPQMSLNAKRDLVLVAKKTCRELRRRSTPSEEIFWAAVRDRRFMGRKFYRQHPIFFDHMGRESFYVADFYCYQEEIVVEIDGKIHDHMAERDRLRTAVINDCGMKVLRFKNEEIEKSLSGVLRRLKEYMERS
jgi:very-short-patch-repair endonuclease